jgi:hypothetical protein
MPHARARRSRIAFGLLFSFFFALPSAYSADASADVSSPGGLGPTLVLTPAPTGDLHLPVMPPWATAPAPANSALPATGAGVVNFYGGRVISNTNVVAVYWTSGVDATIQAMIPGFYQAILKSSYMDWLTEYDTIGKTAQDGQPGESQQHIGRGTYGGAKTITPTTPGTTLTADQIGQELAAQIAMGGVPAPTLDATGNVNSLYMFEFPPGYTIELLGSYSCQAYCAFHWTVSVGGKSVPFGVHPDIAGCPGTCFGTFDAVTTIHSHELMEAITDPEAGLANLMAAPARPIGWVASQGASAEVGDLCWHYFQGDHAPVAGYVVQQIYSDYAGGCVYGIPICDGTVQPPACRACNKYDDGAACGGMTPACATAGTNLGKCVACTTVNPKACTGMTPVCNDMTNTCVGCLKNTDCKAAAPVCNVMTMTCRGCESDAECLAGKFCDLTADAMKGQCVACNLDSQCPVGDLCSLETHTCAPKPPPPMPEAGAGDDGGNGDNGGSGSGSGCGCTAVGGDATPLGVLAFGAGLAVARISRRRRSRSRQGA